MAKRFTDTDKWKRPWFRQLSPKAKLAWFYVLDNCDHCGVWHADFDLMKFQTGQSVSRDEFEQWFAGKFKVIDGDKIFIPSFIKFQQGELSESKNAHKPILAFLQKYNLSLEEIPSASHQDGIMMGPSISKGKSIGIGIKGGVGENENPEPQPDPEAKFLEAYDEYPVRAKGSDAFKRYREQIKTDDDHAALMASIARYKAVLALPENSWRQPKQTFAAFLGTNKSGFFWRDFAEPDGGTNTLSKSGQQTGIDWDRVFGGSGGAA